MKLLSASLLLLALSLSGMKGAFSPRVEISPKAILDDPTGVVAKSLNDGPIDLNDSTEEEIRSYYAPLNNLDDGERNGQNLLKNLKPILMNMYTYSYSSMWKIYEITDREWALSPAEEDSHGEYDAETNKYGYYMYSSSNTPECNNPYVRTLYRNRDENGVTVEAGRIREWGDHANTGTNREHVWAESRGFSGKSGNSQYENGVARTDLHHLMSGDGYVNQSIHNSRCYGNVDKTKARTEGTKKAAFLAGNFYGYPVKTSSNDVSNTVFEPQDCDKGDIARACFYMVARYNNLANETGVITDWEPNLVLADYVTQGGSDSGVYSSDAEPVSMGILSDLLDWHHQDPVDEFEIHRNNLIYTNYQKNRNPFVDYPDWVDMIWGGSSDVASPALDTIYAGSDHEIRHELPPVSSTESGSSSESSSEPLSSSSTESSSSSESSSLPPSSSSEPPSSSSSSSASSSSSESGEGGSTPNNGIPTYILIAAIAGGVVVVALILILGIRGYRIKIRAPKKGKKRSSGKKKK